MELLKENIKRILSESTSSNLLFKRNLIKEYLQILVLNYLYSHPRYSQLVFYGGSCLMHCYGLARLSEDLDFVDLKKKISLAELGEDLKKYFSRQTDLKLDQRVQKFRLYLKFPLLKELKLSKKGESDLLLLKIEIFKKFDFCKTYKTEIIPLFKYNRSILIRTFDLPTLMSTKIRAIFFRKWEKTDKKGKTVARIKGRDYYDLMWYLQRGVKPNLDCIEMVDNNQELKLKLVNIIKRIDTRSIRLDLESFIENSSFVKNLSKNIKNILIKSVGNL
ncbi:nucleotidyl transferase AbiEii/AbiGii toxin family protein [Candidatus Margulisiibacteriota bacterium]